VGLDLMDIERFRRAIDRHGERLLARLFTARERADADGKFDAAARLAARFAAKEALFKALGTGWSEGVSWTEAEVRRAESGRPSLELTGRAAELSRERGAARAHLSLTHSPTTAGAVVILESEPAR
jgi:holo-[acyl-carrier protein] synthase